MIDYLEIEGYKSIKELKIELKPINILIGSNGAGKSNFISFFKLLRAIFNQRLQHFVLEEGKADNLLYFGRKRTEYLFGKVIFKEGRDNNAYYFALAPNKQGGLFIEQEGAGYNVSRDHYGNYFSKNNLEESRVAIENYPRNQYLRDYLKQLQIFHFHDTSSTSSLRRDCDVENNRYLNHDGSNLPAYLYYMKVKHPIVYKRIEYTVRSVAPFFDHFILEPSRLGDGRIELRWNETDDVDSNFSASQFSDGTIRFIALATLLLQPEPPKVIIIDEPELGLHPFAISKLAGMIQAASSRTQLIISTQSVNLVDQFDPGDIIAVDRSREEKQSIFMRLDEGNLTEWLNEHTMGELWQRNIIGVGQPFKQ
ncbi:AAA family ATPase [Roseivirga seohaensis]|uniref:AAA family ATPase n=1 Tax=Roseivirga seohaensis TaxID=1914963 RepID=UPI003BAD91CD